ncbi:MAG TPA: hypothetical protein VIK74_01115 [Parasegetibacter sp.]|jgi:hypothetical protein
MNVLNPFEEEKKKLPTGLNVLTILTFIGSALQLLSIPFTKMGLKFSKQALENEAALENMSQADIDKMEKGIRTMELIVANSTALWIVYILGAALCVYGAIQMRKLKKDGYYIYCVGEVLPVIGAVLILGFANTFVDGSSYFSVLGIPLLFIALYSIFLKHMK